MNMEGTSLHVIVLSILVILALGCIGSPSHSSIQTSSPSSSTESPAPPAENVSHLGLNWSDVFFNATLSVVKNGSIKVKYTYSGVINLTSLNANVSLHWVYSPGNSNLLGNWHFKRIVVTNGTGVKVFEVPPAQWMSVPAKDKSELIKKVLNFNPYSMIRRYVLENVTCANCSLPVHLTVSESRALLSSITFGRQVSSVELNGELFVIGNDKIRVALTGKSGDGTIYKVEVEVKRL